MLNSLHMKEAIEWILNPAEKLKEMIGTQSSEPLMLEDGSLAVINPQSTRSSDSRSLVPQDVVLTPAQEARAVQNVLTQNPLIQVLLQRQGIDSFGGIKLKKEEPAALYRALEDPTPQDPAVYNISTDEFDELLNLEPTDVDNKNEEESFPVNSTSIDAVLAQEVQGDLNTIAHAEEVVADIAQGLKDESNPFIDQFKKVEILSQNEDALDNIFDEYYEEQDELDKLLGFSSGETVNRDLPNPEELEITTMTVLEDATQNPVVNPQVKAKILKLIKQMQGMTKEQQARYLKLAQLKTHPDKGGNAKQFTVMKEAIEWILNPAEKLKEMIGTQSSEQLMIEDGSLEVVNPESTRASDSRSLVPQDVVLTPAQKARAVETALTQNPLIQILLQRQGIDSFGGIKLKKEESAALYRALEDPTPEDPAGNNIPRDELDELLDLNPVDDDIPEEDTFADILALYQEQDGDDSDSIPVITDVEVLEPGDEGYDDNAPVVEARFVDDEDMNAALKILAGDLSEYVL